MSKSALKSTCVGKRFSHWVASGRLHAENLDEDFADQLRNHRLPL